MLDKFKEQRYLEIEDNAKREKETLDYVIYLIKKDFEVYLNAFKNKDINKTNLASHMYHSITNLIERLIQDHLSAFHKNRIEFPKGQEPENPEYLLGWIKYIPLETSENDRKPIRYEIMLTDNFFRIADKYRSCKGLTPLSEILKR